MRTESGLSIHGIYDEQGAFYIELWAPADHDPEESTFAEIRWDDGNGRWNWCNNTWSPDILDVINEVERQYAENRRAVEAEQQQRAQLNKSLAPHWEKVVAKYRGKDDTAV